MKKPMIGGFNGSCLPGNTLEILPGIRALEVFQVFDHCLITFAIPRREFPQAEKKYTHQTHQTRFG